MAINKPTQMITGEVRISYEHLTKPYASHPGAEEKFSATLLIPKSDVVTKQRIDAAMQAAVQEGITSKWNSTRPPQIAIPIYDGDGVRPNGEPFGPECKGHWVMTASSKQRQEIVDMSLEPIIDATQIYSGMYARVCINFFPYNNAGKRGIGCGLGPVQKTRDGEPLGGHMTAADAFGGEQVSYPTQQTGYAPVTASPIPQYGAPAQPTHPAPAAPQPAYPAQQNNISSPNFNPFEPIGPVDPDMLPY